MSDPRLSVLREMLAARRAELDAAVAGTLEGVRDRRPDAEGWSVAMVLEHLADTERGITGLLAGLIQNASPRPASEPFDATAFARRLDMPAFLDRRRRLKLAQPSGTLSWSAARDALTSSRTSLLEVLERSSELRLEDVSRDHPAGVRLDGYQWAAFVGLHEARHAAQIAEIAEQLPEG
ncbi:MAG: DinB family protein [Gemmatimonadales bacterium]